MSYFANVMAFGLVCLFGGGLGGFLMWLGTRPGK